jgi:Na+/melibiose symporter-like transporter
MGPGMTAHPRQEVLISSINGYLALAGGVAAVLAGAWLVNLSVLGNMAGGAAVAGIALIIAGVFVCAACTCCSRTKRPC